jgi:hypothetical protein
LFKQQLSSASRPHCLLWVLIVQLLLFLIVALLLVVLLYSKIMILWELLLAFLVDDDWKKVKDNFQYFTVKFRGVHWLI